ncbi:MAG: hypothetical protein Q9219_007400 [cf. Caloplaca sp. 3 TL-2023]
MTMAFSRLTGIQEFGLSILSGLGWLAGPDVSDRAKLLVGKRRVLGNHYNMPDKETRINLYRWGRIVEMETPFFEGLNQLCCQSTGSFEVRKELSNVTHLPYIVLKDSITNFSPQPPIMFDQINMEKQGPTQWSAALCKTEQIVPNRLTAEQEEWLFEMKWAQDALLATWCTAVLKNPAVFGSLRTFTVANLSSGLLEGLQRDDIWRTMSNLENLNVLVSSDWRQVSKDGLDTVSTELIQPSTAQHQFWQFLSILFEWNRSIKRLKVGYVDGGEQAAGMFARNQNILPAPIIELSGHSAKGLLPLAHVQYLTLTNCWLTPRAIKTFFGKMRRSELKTVILDSVSLTADPNANIDFLSAGPHTTTKPDIAARGMEWLYYEPVTGSWADVIDEITPGHRIAHARYLHGIDVEEGMPNFPKETALKSITFVSCGYVRLPHMPESELNQSTLPKLIEGLPTCLKTRHQSLSTKMLSSTDPLLGTIVPCMTDQEQGCLEAVWGMTMGWGDKEEKWGAREDGMGEGGLGRFSGVVTREEV